MDDFDSITKSLADLGRDVVAAGDIVEALKDSANNMRDGIGQLTAEDPDALFSPRTFLLLAGAVYDLAAIAQVGRQHIDKTALVPADEHPVIVDAENVLLHATRVLEDLQPYPGMLDETRAHYTHESGADPGAKDADPRRWLRWRRQRHLADA